MTDNETFARPNNEAKIYDFQQFTLYAAPLEGSTRRPMLKFGERNGAPRITVIPNTGKPPSIISAGFFPDIFEAFLSEFEKIAEVGKPGTSVAIDNLQKDPTFEGKVANYDDVPKIVKNTLYFGKDEEGVCWLALGQKDAEKIVFRILPSSWHVFRFSDGREMTKAIASMMSTVSLITSLRRSISKFTGRLAVPYTPDPSKVKVNGASGKSSDESGSMSFF